MYEYRVDDGPIHRCNPGEDPCDVAEGDLPGPGRHIIRYAAIDIAGNRSPDASIIVPDEDEPFAVEVKVDAQAPISGAFAAPLTPPGANGWYTTSPWVGVVGFDFPVGGAGFEPAPDDVLPDPDIAYLRYSLDGGAFTDFVAPFQLGDGDHVVCTIAQDLAGNPLGPPEQNCTPDAIRVDTTPPAVTLTVAPSNLSVTGWFAVPMTVTAAASDGGSGFDPSVEPSGLFVSVDGGPYDPVPSTPWTVPLDEGVHVVRAYAVDVAGNRSEVIERIRRIDLSHPVSSLRTFPAAPAANGWFRSLPTVTLRATDGDQNAGVASIRYCLGAGCAPATVYAGPFVVPAGVTVVRWQAVDASGSVNLEPVQSVTLKADIGAPSPVAAKASVSLWSRLLGPAKNDLKWTVTDDHAGPVKVTVIVYDVLGTRCAGWTAAS